MAVYTTISHYIESATCIKDRIDAYSTVISALTTAALKGAENVDIEEYHLNDGQVIIRNTLRDPMQIANAIKSYIKLRQLDINRLNGDGVVRLVDAGSNLRNC